MRLLRLVLAAALLAGTVGCNAASPSNGPTTPAGSPSPTASDEWPEDRVFQSTEITENGAPKTFSPSSDVTLHFGGEGEFTVYGGCHTLTVSAAIENGQLVVAEVVASDDSCAAAFAQKDAWLEAFFTASPEWSLIGEELTLTTETAEIAFAEL
jgi:heat shock protein HslJ